MLNQTQQAGSFIIAVDGLVGDEIEKVLVGLSSESTIKTIRCAKNGGLAVSRKVAIAKASTEHLAVMDSDDILCGRSLRNSDGRSLGYQD